MPQETQTRTLPLLPLRGLIVFPYTVLRFDVGRPKSVEALEKAMAEDGLILLASQKDARTDDPGPEDLFQMGTVAQIKQMLKLPGGTMQVLVEGLSRGRVLSVQASEPYIQVNLQSIPDPSERTPEIEALVRTLNNQFEQYIKTSKKLPPETLASVASVDEPGRLADVAATHLNLKLEEKQSILEATDPAERLELVVNILGKEMEVMELERKINARVRKQMEKTQKEYYLREQLRAIQKELGDKDERQAEADQLRERMSKISLPAEVLEKLEKEIDRLEKMPPASAEGVVLRNYMDTVLSLPWDKQTEDRLDITIAEQIMDEEHYALDKPKDRIIEYLAVRQLTKTMKGPILCLAGPPGVGKTSLAKSVAKALERRFVRISLGGVRDEAEIRGHRRTYVGAMPGRIIQGMKQAGSKNPVFLLDEIDKMSMDFRGDPSAALLEVLDPEQNNTFSDHYVELAFDLSQVLFITTANALHTVPRPLLDRMEVLYISGYTEEEKVEIAKRHLLPKQLKDHGLTNERLTITDQTLHKIISEYTREAGVRNLEREIANVCRKVAKEVVKDPKLSIKVTAQNLHQYLGIPRYRPSAAEKADEVGVATGMAWTETGGEVLAIEVTVMQGKGGLTLTGKLGEVMRESAQAAYSYIRSKAAEFGIDPDFHQKFDIHIHIPEGAIPKDGPSAGITMATALVSALAKRPVRRDVAMTGEITLRGHVLPIGGLKEKVLAAHRAGCNTIVIPSENKKDLEEIPANVKRKLTVHLVESFDEVFRVALRESQHEDKVSAPSDQRS
ncbi:MAG: endopeptidase La [Bacillota bacterium]